jgi:uncharacterized damage-inducible protein DinB
MNGKQTADIRRGERKHLFNILRDFKPDQGGFKPADGMMTVAQQAYHIALTLKWFREGAFGEGFDLDFEKLEAENRKDITLDEALAELNAVYDDYIAFLETLSEEDLARPMPPNPIFGEVPRSMIVGAEIDHTAHHRGALSVYLRLLGTTPRMVYED